jgi:transcriptional regulator with XRE-family HTH domain
MTSRPHYIKDWRLYRKMSQVELAEQLGITQAHISRIENYKRPYDEHLLLKLSEVLKCQPVDLLARKPTDPEGIWSVWNMLLDSQKAQLVEMAHVLTRFSK